MTKINRNCVSDQTLATYQEASQARWISGRLGPSLWKTFWRTCGRWSCRSLRQPWPSKRPQSLPVTRHDTSFHPWSSKASPLRWKRWLRHSWGPLSHSCWSTPQVWNTFGNFWGKWSEFGEKHFLGFWEKTLKILRRNLNAKESVWLHGETQNR